MWPLMVTIDGKQKIRYPMRMYPTLKSRAAFEGNLKYVDTCPNSPIYGKAFCQHHCETASADDLQADLRKALVYKGINMIPIVFSLRYISH